MYEPHGGARDGRRRRGSPCGSPRPPELVDISRQVAVVLARRRRRPRQKIDRRRVWGSWGDLAREGLRSSASVRILGNGQVRSAGSGAGVGSSVSPTSATWASIEPARPRPRAHRHGHPVRAGTHRNRPTHHRRAPGDHRPGMARPEGREDPANVTAAYAPSASGIEERDVPSSARSFGHENFRSPGTSTNRKSPSLRRTTSVLTMSAGRTPRAATASARLPTGPVSRDLVRDPGRRQRGQRSRLTLARALHRPRVCRVAVPPSTHSRPPSTPTTGLKGGR